MKIIKEKTKLVSENSHKWKWFFLKMKIEEAHLYNSM
jgi:hypothetical protein